MDAMIEGIVDGSVDVFPRPRAAPFRRKAQEFDHAPFGIVGLETACRWYGPARAHRYISLARAVELLSVNRADHPPAGRLAGRGQAPTSRCWTGATVPWGASTLQSKSKNTPFDGWTLKGAAAATIVGGRTVYTNPDVAGAAAFA